MSGLVKNELSSLSDMNRLSGAPVFGEVYTEYSGVKGRNYMNSKVKFGENQVYTIFARGSEIGGGREKSRKSV